MSPFLRRACPTITALGVLLLALVAGPVSAQSGRLSLSDRVAKLEAAAANQNNQPTIDLLNRIDDLQTEIQSLRGMIEQQSFEIEELKKRARDQYVDLDSRLSRLEGNPATIPTPTAPVNPVAVDPSMPTEPAPPVPADAGVALPGNPSGANGANPAVPTNPVPNVPAPPPGSNDEQAAYDIAFAALREGRYAESARRFSEFLQLHPNGELADNATYWLGESYYVTQNYRIALDTFRELLTRFPASQKAPDAQLKLGYCHYELREWDQAEAALNEVIARYPETTVARLAQGRLRALRLEGRTP
jgi:tol-pal system protein YbgF